MTLATLLSNLYRRLNYADTPDSAVTTRLTMFLNQRHRALLTSSALKSLRMGFTSMASVAAQPEYGLPYGVSRILTIRETTNDRVLSERSWDWYRQQEPDPVNQSGTPYAWAQLGQRAVAAKPADTGVWVASSAAGDTTQTVTIVGIVGTTPAGQRGATLSASALLTGTARVRLGTATFDDVVSWSVGATCVGSLSLFDAAAAGNTLGVLPIGRQVARNFVLALAPTPALPALTYSIDFEHAITDMSNTWDQPLLPEDFHDILIPAVLADEYQHRGDDRYSAAYAEYQQRLSELKVWIFNHRPATQQSARRQLAPLPGGWYPAQYN